MNDYHHRRSIRLPDYDYSSVGAYFVTICTKDRECLFGEIVDGEMRVNEVGRMVQERLQLSASICDEIELDEYVIMPDHIHFIVWILGACAARPGICEDRTTQCKRQGAWHAPLRRPRSVSSFVGLFKSKTTSMYRNSMKDEYVGLWQRNYFERIIRDDRELNAIREYIIGNPIGNPKRWAQDSENGDFVGACATRPGPWAKSGPK